LNIFCWRDFDADPRARDAINCGGNNERTDTLPKFTRFAGRCS
jgi:hypothetical protein